MRGEFAAVWCDTWDAIWGPLTEGENVPIDIYCDLYRELSRAFAVVPSIETLADVIDDPAQSREALKCSAEVRFASEKSLVHFFEAVYEILEDLQGQDLADRYYDLLSAFIEKYSLGYSIRRPCSLSPTLEGMFADLSAAVKRMASANPHLLALHRAHEEAVKDLRFGASEERIKTCISRQFMLLEGIAATSGGITAQTLGDMCGQLTSWPHPTIRESLKRLYGFASDYPGIRHGGNPAAQLRNVDSRDLVALSVVLMGYSHYLTGDLKTTLQSFVQD